MNDLRIRLMTDPILVFVKAIMSPDRTGQPVAVPSDLRDYLGTNLINADSERWIAALKPVRSASLKLTKEEQVYRIAFQYFLEFIECVSHELKSTYDHEKAYDWLTRWLHLLTCPIRWTDSKHKTTRAEIRKKITDGVELTDEEIYLFNDHGIYQVYGIYETFILYHNPKAWQVVKSFRMQSQIPPIDLDFVDILGEGKVKIDREGEIYHDWNNPDEAFIDFRGLWNSEGKKIFARTCSKNLKVFAKDFYPPLELPKKTDIINSEYMV